MFIVVYRPNYEANMFTKFYGPFADYLAAEDFLGTLPAIGHYDEESEEAQNGFANSGVKYITELSEPVLA